LTVQHGAYLCQTPSHGTGGLTFDKTKKSWPSELNVLLALIIIIVIFEFLGQVLPYMNDQSFLFDTKDRFDSIFQRSTSSRSSSYKLPLLAFIALGVSQVIITGGIDLSSGPLVAATAMIAMSFGQTGIR
jgi:inositol transport system permease protein